MTRIYVQTQDVTLYHGDFREVLPSLVGTVITDPPYNRGYHYHQYLDRVTSVQYHKLLEAALRTPSVVLHYPEDIFKFSVEACTVPTRLAAWVYHANTPKQWRMVAWFGTTPDFKKGRQPYKNPRDKRIKALVAAGSPGAELYAWWHVEQVKNVSKSKTSHPCQIPFPVMDNIVAVTEGETIIDPFMGSGTTLLAARKHGRRTIGCDVDERYCEIVAKALGL